MQVLTFYEPIPGFLAEVGDPEWQQFPVVHYCTRGMAEAGISRGRKAAGILRLRKV